jgi:putative sterol carrier protein
VIGDLARAGLRLLGPPGPGEDVGAEALVLALNASFRPEAGKDESYELELDGEPFAVAIREGVVETARGPAAEPRLTIATSARTFAELLSGAIDPGAAIEGGELRLDGPRSALDRFLAAFSYPAAARSRFSREAAVPSRAPGELG